MRFPRIFLVGLLCLIAGAGVRAAADDHWAFRPLTIHHPPADPSGISAHPIDLFLAAKWREMGRADERLAPPADRRTLLRRATFDLVGLPPTPQEIEAFLADDAPDAFERVVDKLLASPHYGERWGRHWLDVARYADTAGNPPDFPVPQAYRYRNWVIDAFRRDLPYDQFVREQVAGDLMGGDTDQQRADRIVATGYLALHRRFFGSAEGNADHLEIEDVLNTLGRSLLGLSLSCARCHDHKFDPITTREYYALYGIFQSTRYPFPGAEGNAQPTQLVSLPGDQRAYAVSDAEAKNARVHVGGDPGSAGEEVPRGFLEVAGGQQLAASAAGSGRMELAAWLADEKRNPLLSRVMVNRLWQHHFGQGLVETASDFGIRGTSPTHPDLLDYLAARFIESGWSIKAMHRLIVTSAAYQRASTASPEETTIDPSGEWLWRYPRRRLDAESIRDAMLAASGELDRSMGGEHPFPPQDQWGFSQHAPFQAVYETNRRSIYLMQQRSKKHPFLALFDGADPNASTANRLPTTTPIQALFLMNDEFVHRQADSLARRVLAEATSDDQRLRLAFLLTLSRPPTSEESAQFRAHVAKFSETLSQSGAAAEAQGRQAWASVARVLFGSNEFLHID